MCVLQAFSYVGSVLQLPMISKDQAGAYLCIASVSCWVFYFYWYRSFIFQLFSLPLQNGIPPTVSKRISVIVNCKFDLCCSYWIMKMINWLMILQIVKPKIFVQRRVVYSSIGQKIQLECESEAYPNSGNIHPSFAKHLNPLEYF